MIDPPPPHWLSLPEPGAACAVIAEIAQAHDGSLGQAHAYIDCAARAGAHAVKFQTHIASAESTAAEPWRVKFSKQDATRYDYWRRMEFSPEQWAGLKTHADEMGLIFLSSPFSGEAVELLRRLDMAAWKVASGELTNLPMIREMTRDGRPIMLSSGMSPLSEIDAAVEVVRAAGSPFATFQCTTRYPSPPEAIGLNVLDELRARYGSAVGLSDHSGTIYPALAASAAHAIEIVEVHLTMTRELFGPDVVASVTPAELRQIVDGTRFIDRMRAAPLDKSTLDPSVAGMRDIFLKSVVAARDLKAGSVVTREDLGLKKPGAGIPAAEVDTLVGRRLAHDVTRDAALKHEDFSAS
ncbi:N-acetylneuraminate synthase family protein [Methylopila sp. M107]|uniref:N-acetylneuraminate synthase family protein n=1 Tax=Methylopila sp. M107 TaxID=1101190 RepID=UPI0018CB7F6F|nr:N-acetylneuraminate synthase family protein [Methylopila sp. M107]